MNTSVRCIIRPGDSTFIYKVLFLFCSMLGDPDPRGSALILFGWIWIRIRNADRLRVQADPQKKKKKNVWLRSSVADPGYFGVYPDPDLRIHASD